MHRLTKSFFVFSKKLSPSVSTIFVPRRKSATSRHGSDFGLVAALGRPSLAQITSSPDNVNGVSASAFAVATQFAHKALVVRKTRNEHAEEVFERSRQMLESCNFSTIDCRY